MARFWIDVDGDGEPTIWCGNPERPMAVLRRCEVSGSDEVRDEVMRRIAGIRQPAAPSPNVMTWRCIANACNDTDHQYAGWDEGQEQTRRHAAEVAHDPSWPLTIVWSANGRRVGVTYVPSDLRK